MADRIKISLEPMIDFGRMPIANAFLTPQEFEREYFYNMVLGYDPKTKVIGLVNRVPSEMMFHNHYAYYSSTSKAMQEHFRKAAQTLKPLVVGEGLVVEVGSNDGIMLEAWKNLAVPALGIEPSANVAQVSQTKGHEVIVKFFTEEAVAEVLAKGRKVSLVYEANTLCSLQDIVEYFELVEKLIGKKGVCVIEEPYFMEVMRLTAYDQIYDEHIWYFTVSAINSVVEPLGYHVFDCEFGETHGGSLRMFIGHKDTHPQKSIVSEYLARERDLPQQLAAFKNNIEKSKTQLLDLLNKIKKDGKRICGFGATSKGVIVCNYCGIGPDLIPFITDNTPIKQGKYYPGVHIPVKSQEEFKNVDYGMLFAWNHFKEISSSQSWFREAGGRWLTHVPRPHVIE